MTVPKSSPYSPHVAPPDEQACNPLEESLKRVLAEQRAAAAYLAVNPTDRGAQTWLNDWVAEEILARRV